MDLSSGWSSRAPCHGTAEISGKNTLSYLESFLPVYQMVNQAANSSLTNRYHAIKFAADASLATTAGGAKWSDALGKQLAATCRESAHSRREEQMRAGAAAIENSREVELPSPTVRTEYETCELAENGACGPNFDTMREPVAGVEEKDTDGSRLSDHNTPCSRARAESRLPLSRTLLRRNRREASFLKRRWKPNPTIRKVRTSSKSRRRFFPKRTRSVGSQVHQELDQRVQTSLLTLQRLVPGGVDMDEALLLGETAHFLTFLKLQVQALESVASAVDEQFGDRNP